MSRDGAGPSVNLPQYTALGGSRETNPQRGVGDREGQPLITHHTGQEPAGPDRLRTALVVVLALAVLGSGGTFYGIQRYRELHPRPPAAPEGVSSHGANVTVTGGKGSTSPSKADAHDVHHPFQRQKVNHRPTPAPTMAPTPDPRTARFGKLIFAEEFDGDELDLKTWNVERTLGGGGNFEFQYYTDDPNVLFVKDGNLNVKPGYFKDLGKVHTESGWYDAEDVMFGHCQPFPNCSTFHVPNCTNDMWLGCKRTGGDPEGNLINPVLSGRINSRYKFSFKYGRLEFKAKLPRGDYLWPALWLLPEDEVYGGWPASGEIDVMESRGNKPGYIVGGEQAGFDAFGSTLHYGNLIQQDNGDTLLLDGWRNAHSVVTDSDGSDYTTDMHIFGLYWTESEMYTYTVDQNGEEVIALNLTKGFYNGFWAPPLGGEGDPAWSKNPYEGAPINAPFDQAFYLVINLAVGGQEGNLGYWAGAPWSGCKQPKCFTQGSFWFNRDKWQPSWEQAARDGLGTFQIDSIRVWQKEGVHVRRAV